MTSDLITKNKIVEYIGLYPQAKTNILLWVKEFGQRGARGIESYHLEGVTEVFAQLGASDFRIKYNYNPWVNTAYITWFGTSTEHAQEYRREMENMSSNNSEIILEPSAGHTEVILTPPPPLQAEVLSKLTDVSDLKRNSKPVFNGELYTKPEYERALDRLIEVFDVKPGTPDFAEVELLLLSIKRYEEDTFILPKLDPIDLVKVRMKEFQILPQEIAHLVGGEEDMDLFLEGKKVLPLETLRKLFLFVGIRHVDIYELLN